MAVRGRDGPRRVEAERPELVGLVVAAGRVHLVDREERGASGALEDASDLLVLGREAGLAVDDEDDRVGLLGGHEGLRADRGLELVGGLARLDTAGVDEQEVDAVPVGVVVAAVARDAARLVHDGVGGLGDAVHERRLAHVRATDDSDDR